jgi:hypothetical protein
MQVLRETPGPAVPACPEARSFMRSAGFLCARPALEILVGAQ